VARPLPWIWPAGCVFWADRAKLPYVPPAPEERCWFEGGMAASASVRLVTTRPIQRTIRQRFQSATIYIEHGIPSVHEVC